MHGAAAQGQEPTHLGKYEIVRPIASGGMARIYLARTTGIGDFERYVVLKLILPERQGDAQSVQMFLDEARLAAMLSHQNIAQVTEVGEDGVHYLAMEYVHGQDARTILGKARALGRRIPLELALTIVVGAAAGLHHAHERRGPVGEPLGIVHRDVSPSNIMVGYDGSVKVLDFGIAKATSRTVETVAGVIKGKFAYMSPEQCRGRDVDRRSDVFSLGILLYELTTQRRCFRADSDFDIMHRIVTGDIVSPTSVVPDYPPALEAIVMRAMALDPAYRFSTAAELIHAIEAFAGERRTALSNTALGAFMHELFGEVPEPWHGSRTASRTGSAPALRREQTISNADRTGSHALESKAAGAETVRLFVPDSAPAKPSGEPTAAIAPTLILPVPNPMAEPPPGVLPPTTLVSAIPPRNLSGERENRSPPPTTGPIAGHMANSNALSAHPAAGVGAYNVPGVTPGVAPARMPPPGVAWAQRPLPMPQQPAKRRRGVLALAVVLPIAGIGLFIALGANDGTNTAGQATGLAGGGTENPASGSAIAALAPDAAAVVVAATSPDAAGAAAASDASRASGASGSAAVAAPDAAGGGSADTAVKQAKVQFVITSEPEGATVRRGGRVVGTTPYQVTEEQGTRQSTFRVEAAGYIPQDVALSHEDDVNRTVVLKAAAKRVDVATRDPSRNTSRSDTSRRDDSDSRMVDGSSGEESAPTSAGTIPREPQPAPPEKPKSGGLKPRGLDCKVLSPGRPVDPFDKRPVCN